MLVFNKNTFIRNLAIGTISLIITLIATKENVVLAEELRNVSKSVYFSNIAESQNKVTYAELKNIPQERAGGVSMIRPIVTSPAKNLLTKPVITTPPINKPQTTKPTVTKPSVNKPQTTKPIVTKPPVNKPQPTKPLVKKEKPQLSYSKFDTNDFNKELHISYNLTDKNKAYVKSKLSVYDGEKLIRNTDIKNLSSVMEKFDFYDNPYRIVTTMTYDINDGKGNREETLEEKVVEFNVKKLEIKDANSVKLFKYNNGDAISVPVLSSVPTDINNYFIKVESDRFKTKVLPVSKIEEVNQAGNKFYKVNSDVPELVEDIDSTIVSNYKTGFSFLVPKNQNKSDGDVYVNFRDLASAIKNNPAGSFKLGSELYAEEIEVNDNQTSYFGNFSGNLIGANNNQNYSIYGLKLPLFDNLSGHVSNLDLEDIQIDSTDSVLGALARETTNTARISNVSVAGTIRGQRNVGGLVGISRGANIDNVSFIGDIYSLNNNKVGEAYTGGIIASMFNGNLTRAYVDANINTYAGTNNQRSGGIVGNSSSGEATTISKVYSKGTIINRSAKENGAGGIIGSIYPSANLREATSEMNVQGGALVYADTDHQWAKIDMSTVSSVEGAVATKVDKWSNKIIKVEALSRLKNYGITATIDDSKDTRISNKIVTDYTKLNKASADRKVAYLNVEKLMPFYNKEQVVKYGNLVDTGHKLYSRRLLSVIPMYNDEIVSNISGNNLNKLLLHYEDGSMDYLSVNYKGEFNTTAISEYNITGTELIYTPEQYLNDYSSIVKSTSQDLKNVKFKSEEVLNSLGVLIDNNELATLVQTGLTEKASRAKIISDKMDQLYLESAFDKVKENIEEHLFDILATDKLIDTTNKVINDYTIDYIKDNKEQLLLGLSYVQRWYNINFDGFNFQKLATFHQDFFGKPVSTLEWLVDIAKKGYENIKPANNVRTYSVSISSNTGIDNQIDYLSRLRKVFLPNKTDAQWFKENTKAYIVEQVSEEVLDMDVSFWQRVKDSVGIPIDDLNGILPLLTADEGIFIITNMSSITYGMYDRYFDMNLKTTKPAEYEKQVKLLKEKINYTAKRLAENMDVWYRFANDSVKVNMRKVIPIWDGYKRFDNKWLPMYDVDSQTGAKSNKAILDFFGPVGERAVVTNNGVGAIANGWLVKFVHYSVLSDMGLATYAHEMTHNLDGSVYLGGYGRRDGMGAESYATGMFEAPKYNSDVLAYNFIFDNSSKGSAKNRLQAENPERFNTVADLQEYARRSLDILYTLDYAEAKSVLSKSKTDQRKWYMKIENVLNSKGEVSGRYRAITDLEWNAMNLLDIDDLVENDLMTKRSYPNVNKKDLSRNGYDAVRMFSPIYSALSNDNGVPSNSLIFKLRSYELMAVKGYKDGFLPYASNQLNAEAKVAGLATQTEKFVLDKIFNGKYKSWSEFKKAMYKERVDKVVDLKPVTIDYNGTVVRIKDFRQLQSMMDTAVNQDLIYNTIFDPNKSRVHALKSAIYNAYLRGTKDFRQSIYRR
ncbi:MAG: ZmpA/ZmpB/ZmpC family metallo-endopeptidase [Gemella sp.]|nr:ZmpA/ZmpB/ZmpC family metallo-endopeptidase [Gemella sp.]